MSFDAMMNYIRDFEPEKIANTQIGLILRSIDHIQAGDRPESVRELFNNEFKMAKGGQSKLRNNKARIFRK